MNDELFATFEITLKCETTAQVVTPGKLAHFTRFCIDCKYNIYIIGNTLCIAFFINHLGCTAHKFMCSDGQCIPMTKYCNSVNDCADQSDELNCGKL